MTRTRVRRRLVVVTVATALASAWAPALGRALHGGDVEQVARSRYVVRTGDTVWSIAAAMSPADDPRPLVDAITEVNGIDPRALVPGQTLVIPDPG